MNPELKKKQTPNYLTVPASIDKADIPRLCVDLAGAVNSEDVSLNGKPYVAGSLEFHGFAGALSLASGKYEGVYRFLPFVILDRDFNGNPFPDAVSKWFAASDIPGLVEDETELLVEGEQC